MTRYTNHNQVAHAWWRGETSGRANNMIIAGPTIYSYGRNFPIASHVYASGERFTLFTIDKHSVITTKHITRVKSAIDHYATTVLYAPLSQSVIDIVDHALKYGLTEKMQAEIASWSTYWDREAKKSIDTAARARVHGASHLEHARNCADKWQAIARFARFAWDVCLVAPENILRARDISEVDIEEYRRVAREKEKAYRAQELEKRKAEIEAWKMGAGSFCPHISNHYFLRIKDAHIETSGGVKIPISLAKRLLPLAIRAFDGAADKSTFVDADFGDIGGYPVHAIDAENWIIGCHVIPVSELRRIADEIKGA